MFSKKNLLVAFIIGIVIFFISYSNLSNMHEDNDNSKNVKEGFKDKEEKDEYSDAFYRIVGDRKKFEEIAKSFKDAEVFFISSGIKDLSNFVDEESEYYKKRYNKLVEIRKNVIKAELLETYVESIEDNKIEFEIKVKYLINYTYKDNTTETVEEYILYKLVYKDDKYYFVDEIDLNEEDSETE